MTVALIVAGSVLAALLLIAFAVWAHQYTKVGPNEVLIISGRAARDGGPSATGSFAAAAPTCGRSARRSSACRSS